MLPMSAKKLALVDSDASVTRALTIRDPELASCAKTALQNLGVDFTLRGLRRTGVFEARMRKTAKKVLKLRQLRKTGVSTVNITAAVINSASVYGASCLGASLSKVRRRRAMTHLATTDHTNGRSVTMDLALTFISPVFLDPAYALTLAPIYAIASALWDGWTPRQWSLRSWATSFNRYVDGNVSWMTVADPSFAAAAFCARIGWSSPSPGVLRTQEGVLLSLDEVCPKTVLKLGQYAV